MTRTADTHVTDFAYFEGNGEGPYFKTYVLTLEDDNVLTSKRFERVSHPGDGPERGKEALIHFIATESARRGMYSPSLLASLCD